MGCPESTYTSAFVNLSVIHNNAYPASRESIHWRPLGTRVKELARKVTGFTAQSKAQFDPAPLKSRFRYTRAQVSNGQHKTVMIWLVRAPSQHLFFPSETAWYIPYLSLPAATLGLIPRLYISNLHMLFLIPSLIWGKGSSATISCLDEMGHCQHISVAPQQTLCTW